MNKLGVFRHEGSNVVLNDNYCEFYIPKAYLDSKWATMESDRLRTIGIFNVGLFDAKGNIRDLKVFNVPTECFLNVYDTDDRVVEFKQMKATDCLVLKYVKDQIIMEDSVIEDSEYAQTFLDIVMKGKLPNTIPYDKVLQVWRKNLELTSVNFNVPSSVLEMILATCYRDKDNIQKKFATVAGSNKDVSMYDYVMLNIRRICQYSSTFTGMTFEDINSMITTSLNRSRDKIEEMESPVEQIIKF